MLKKLRETTQQPLRTEVRAGQRVPWRGLEPPRPYGHSILNAARLPVPPPGQGRHDTILQAKVSLKKPHDSEQDAA